MNTHEEAISTEALALVRQRVPLSDLAEHLDISSSAICQWSRVPVHHVLPVESISGVSRYTLRPDVYQKEATDGTE